MIKIKYIEIQYSDLILRYYRKNKDIIVKLNLFNNFITKDEIRRKKNKSKIKKANKNQNKKVLKNYKNSKVKKNNKSNEKNRKFSIVIIVININKVEKDLCYKIYSKMIKIMNIKI